MALKTGWYILFLVVSAIPLGCSKGSCNVVPAIGGGGGFGFLLGDPDNAGLRLPNGVAKSEEGGVAGLIVVNLGGGKYVAYDRYSTVQGGCPIEVEEGNLTAIDPCTKARYLLLNGSPIDIAKCSLKPYFANRPNEGDVVYVRY